MFFSILYSIIKTGLFQQNFSSEINECIQTLNEMRKNTLPSIPISINSAKKLAVQINSSTPLIFGWDVFTFVAQQWAMLFNQNTKRLSNYYIVPNCTYYSLVGWAHHIKSHEYTSIIFRDHQLESKEMKKRLHFLERFYQDVTENQISINPIGKNILSKIFSLLYLGEITSVYSAFLLDVDPGPTPIIHQLDEELTIL
jgi:glucose/mannose-6-phosphate isomerase